MGEDPEALEGPEGGERVGRPQRGDRQGPSRGVSIAQRAKSER
jgi:hypothetical protein